MINIRQHCLLQLCLIISLSCSRQADNIDKYKVALVKAGTKEFILDDYTSPLSVNVTYYDKDTVPLYIHYNWYNSTFHFYRYSDGKHLKSVEFKKIKNASSAFYYNHDSVFFMSWGIKNQVIIADTTGKIINNIVTDANKNGSYIKPNVNCVPLHPILVKGSRLYYSSILLCDFLENSSYYRLGGWYDLDNGGRNNFVPFPWFYFNSDWGVLKYCKFSHCFDKNNMIVSFYAADYLYIYSLASGTMDSVLCKSEYFDNIPPLGKKKENPFFDETKSYHHFVVNGSYNAVFYDKYRDVYYRVAELPRKENEFDKDNIHESLKKPFSIIIIDKDFNKIGETLIGNQYMTDCSMVTPDGLLIARFNTEGDTITYDIFKITDAV